MASPTIEIPGGTSASGLAKAVLAAAGVVVTVQDTAEKGAANGYAGLDGSGKVPGSQLPAASGVTSLAKSGSTGLTGAVTLSQGANVTLTQVGQDIAIAAAAGAAAAYPSLVDVDVFMTAIANTGWNGLATTTSAVYNAVKNQGTPAQNNSISFDVLLAAGTWTLEVMFAKSNSSGISKCQLSSDGGANFTTINASPYNASGATYDAFNATALFNQLASFTGVTIGTAQVYRLRIIVDAKNASSSNFQGSLQHIQFRRTA